MWNIQGDNMRNLYVLRHGETEWNTQNRICGVSDVPLTENGILQPEKAAEDILKNNIKIDIIISSPLKRANATADVIASAVNLPVRLDARLTEHNYGVFEGKDRKTDGFLATKKNLCLRYIGGESAMNVAARVFPLIEEYKSGEYDGKNILFVTHGGVARVIHSYFDRMTNEDFFGFALDNCRLMKYPLCTGKVILLCGKICAGKSTYVRSLTEKMNAEVYSPDEIILRDYPQQLGDKHAQIVDTVMNGIYENSARDLKSGKNVIIDAGLWTKEERRVIREFYTDIGAQCEIHYVRVSDKQWEKNIEKRNRAVLDGTVTAYFIDENMKKILGERFEQPDESEYDVLYEYRECED